MTIYPFMGYNSENQRQIESVIHIAAVHAHTAGGADRAGGRNQSFRPSGHILIGRGGHVCAVAVGIFKDRFEKHCCTL